jgi:RNA polymerase sigma factor (sigma-70 family)
MLTVQGVGNYKIDYKNHNDVEFSSLSTYILLAKKAISKFANQFYNGLSSKMLKDEDAISSVANAIMMADWRWDENYTNDKGTKKNKYSYRNQCALWAIQTFVSKDTKLKKKRKVFSLDHILGDDESATSGLFIEDVKSQSPLDIVVNKETKGTIQSIINNMFDLDYLSDRQKDYIKLYYFDGYTFDKIGKKYGITREAVRQGLNKAIDMIKNSVAVC